MLAANVGEARFGVPEGLERSKGGTERAVSMAYASASPAQTQRTSLTLPDRDTRCVKCGYLAVATARWSLVKYYWVDIVAAIEQLRDAHLDLQAGWFPGGTARPLGKDWLALGRAWRAGRILEDYSL